jgi:hypothetical protein
MGWTAAAVDDEVSVRVQAVATRRRRARGRRGEKTRGSFMEVLKEWLQRGHGS